MKVVWIVHNRWDGSVKEVYDTEEKAEGFCKAFEDRYYVEKWVVN